MDGISTMGHTSYLDIYITYVYITVVGALWCGGKTTSNINRYITEKPTTAACHTLLLAESQMWNLYLEATSFLNNTVVN